MNLKRHWNLWGFVVMVWGITTISCSDNEEKGTTTPPPEEEAEIDLFINEVFSTGDPDWLELYNPSDEAVSLEGYFIYDDINNRYELGSDITLPANGHFILYCDDQGTGNRTNFKLSSGGETVTLVTADNKLVNEVTFPAMNDGEVYARFPDGGDWALSSTPTPDATNGSSSVTRILSVTQNPQVVLVNQDIEISVELDRADVSSIVVIYSINGGTANEVSMSLTSDNVYTATIPASSESTEISYQVIVTDVSEEQIAYPSIDETLSIVISSASLPELFINEFMAVNVSCCPDTDGEEEEFDDWIEIYNDGNSAVDIGGYYLTDDESDPFKFQVPTSNSNKTVVPAKGFLLLWADDDTEQGENHLGFKLSASGEHIGLHFIDGRQIDGYTFQEQAEGRSEGRITDGGSLWTVFFSPSPNQSNE